MSSFGASPFGHTPYGSGFGYAPLPGSGGVLYIVNKSPAPEEDHVSVEKIFNYGVRTLSDAVSLSKLQSILGYAQCVFDGKELPENHPRLIDSGQPFSVAFQGFDDIFGNPLDEELITRNINSVVIDKPLELIRPDNGTQGLKSCYYISEEILPDCMTTTQFWVTVNQYSTGQTSYFNDPNYTGILLGSVYGPERTAILLFLVETVSGNYVHIVGPANPITGRTPSYINGLFKWQQGIEYKFKIIWHPLMDTVKILVNWPGSGEDTELARFAVSSLNKLHPSALIGEWRYNTSIARTTAIFGIDGHTINDQLTVYRIELHNPISSTITNGITQPGHTVVIANCQSSKLTPDRQLTFQNYWTRPDERSDEYFSPFAPNLPQYGEVGYEDGAVWLHKVEIGDINVFTREEPSFVNSLSSWCLEATVKGVMTRHVGMTTSGMGFRIQLTDLVIDLQMLDDYGPKTFGVRMAVGDEMAASNYHQPIIPIDWSEDVDIRLLADGDKNTLNLYANDITTPVLSIALDSVALPSALSLPRGIYLGHHYPVHSECSMILSRVWYGLNMTAYEANILPEASTPPWIKYGAGISSIVADRLSLDDPGYDISSPDALVYTRAVDLNSSRGITVDYTFSVDSWKSPSGYINYQDMEVPVGICIYNGAQTLKIGCVEASSRGKFISLIGAAGTEDEVEDVINQTVRGRELSHQVNWEEEHALRVDWDPLGEIKVYIDNMRTPVISVDSQTFNFISNPAYLPAPGIAFGSLELEVATKSQWQSVRYFLSPGFDIQMNKRMTDAEKSEAYGSRAQVVIETETT